MALWLKTGPPGHFTTKIGYTLKPSVKLKLTSQKEISQLQRMPQDHHGVTHSSKPVELW